MIPFHVWQITYFSLKNDGIASWKFSNEVIYEPVEYLGLLNVPLNCETAFLFFCCSFPYSQGSGTAQRDFFLPASFRPVLLG